MFQSDDDINREIDEAARELTSGDANPRFTSRVLAGLDVSPRSRHLSLRRLVWIGMPAAAAIALVIALLTHAPAPANRTDSTVASGSTNTVAVRDDASDGTPEPLASSAPQHLPEPPRRVVPDLVEDSSIPPVAIAQIQIEPLLVESLASPTPTVIEEITIPPLEIRPLDSDTQ